MNIFLDVLISKPLEVLQSFFFNLESDGFFKFMARHRLDLVDVEGAPRLVLRRVLDQLVVVEGAPRLVLRGVLDLLVVEGAPRLARSPLVFDMLVV